MKLRYLACLIVFAAAPATAQQPGCGTFEAMRRQIEGEKYLERPVVEMKDRGGIRVVIWANPDTETWTMLRISPNGQLACVIEAGSAFGPAALEPLPAPGDET